MKAVSGKELCKVLERHGWVFQRIKGSHHIYARDGRADIISVPVHGNKTLKTGMQRAIMKQAGLTEADLDP
jgi:predicted RNA binding protein YcfA (HicA-like mRNA interferase family)